MNKIIHRIVSLITVIAITTSCGESKTPSPRVDEFASDTLSLSGLMIPYEPQGDHEIVKVSFNGVTFNLLLDTGCTITTLSFDDFVAMAKEGKIRDFDYRDTDYATIADGSIMENLIFNIETITLPTVNNGKPIELHDVSIAISPYSNSSPRLLGKNILDQLGNWTIDKNSTCIVIQ